MPRPGPRPYECVRRAWHSDRHQPIRGSLIKEIFRIANEIHNPATKKNKEWQEKLPIVVLKAEEILYSKANSEAEYMDLKTLRDRANDAINTIIRRDGSSELTGEFLQPCIEAALHLGCIPRRASRSQRNNHPRGYLTGNVALGNANEGNPRITSSVAPHYSNFLGKESPNFVMPINSCISKEMPFLPSQKCLPLEPSFPSKPFPFYPLYYGFYSQPIQSQQKLGALLPTSSSINEDHQLQMRVPQKHSFCRDENKMEVLKNPPKIECDLSLRLGIGSMHNGVKNNIIASQQESKEGLFSLYGESNGGSRGEVLDVELMMRKRKAVEQIKDHRCPWKPKILPTYSNGRTKTAGL